MNDETQHPQDLDTRPGVAVTNTLRPGETEEQTLSRSVEGRAELERRRQASDPAPDPIDAARKRASELVANISTNTKLELGRRRDELDNAMARITKSEEALTRYITEFARFNYEALEHAKAIAENISELSLPFKADPPATLTQLKNGKET